jgi:hypothetical protein
VFDVSVFISRFDETKSDEADEAVVCAPLALLVSGEYARRRSQGLAVMAVRAKTGSHSICTIPNCMLANSTSEVHTLFAHGTDGGGGRGGGDALGTPVVDTRLAPAVSLGAAFLGLVVQEWVWWGWLIRDNHITILGHAPRSIFGYAAILRWGGARC